MLSIQDSRIYFESGQYTATCVCGKTSAFTTKAACMKMLKRGSCRYCKRDYRNINIDIPVYKRPDGKWCSNCSGCGVEQAYTRKDHAKQSELSDWQCKTCVSKAKGFSNNQPVGSVQRLYNKFLKSAISRNIEWSINISQFENAFTGKCALTGWKISMKYGTNTASLDRIDSNKGYTPENIQWVHVRVNMCKNKYSQNDFIEMCRAVTKKDRQ